MKLYVVTAGCYSDKIIAIFSSKELADNLKKSADDYNDIEEYELDTFKDFAKSGYKIYSVHMKLDGDILNTYVVSGINVDIINSADNPMLFTPQVYKLTHPEEHLYIHNILAKSDKEAIKIANEARVLYVT